MAYYVSFPIHLLFPMFGDQVFAKSLGPPSSNNASCLCFLLLSPSVLCSPSEAPHSAADVHCSEHGVVSFTSLLLLQCHDVWPEGSDQECRHVWGHATGCCWLRHAGYGEVQHREGHCCLYQEGASESYGCWLGVGMEIWTGDLGKEVYPMQTKPRSLQSRQIREWFSPKHSP